MGKTAVLIKNYLNNFRGHASLYKLSEPISYKIYDKDYIITNEMTEYIVCSTIDTSIGNIIIFETYMFPANENGEILDLTELPGSEKETDSHSRVLKNLGYELELFSLNGTILLKL